MGGAGGAMTQALAVTGACAALGVLGDSPDGRRLGVGSSVLCTGECQAIQDVEDGWEGFCLGLQKINTSTTRAACREACCGDPTCEVWQWGNPRSEWNRELGSCYIGRGLECSSDRFDDFLVLAGQRISHGTVSETIDLEPGVWCTGGGMTQAAGVAALSATGTYKSSVDQCQKVCFADPACSIWEHSTEKGCWYGYSDKCARGAEGRHMVAGERVARACGAGVLAPAPTDYVTVFGIIGAVALVLTCCAALILLLGGGRPRADLLLFDEVEMAGRLSREDSGDSRISFVDSLDGFDGPDDRGHKRLL